MTSLLCLAMCATTVAGNPFDNEYGWPALNGTWSIMGLKMKEKPLLKDGLQPLLTIENGRISISDGRLFERVLRFSIDPTTHPMTATSTFDDGTVVKSVVAIYRLNGDEMTICFDIVRADVAEDHRPNSFDSDAHFLLYCKRVQPPGIATEAQRQLKRIENSIGMSLVRIPEGEFLMGSITSAVEDEKRHRVRIDRPIFMSAHEVTTSQFDRIMAANKGETGDETPFPVASATWYDAVSFCDRLSSVPEEFSAGRWYRLPTEAEWEYACRAGSITRYNVGRQLSQDDANVAGDAPLGSKNQRSTVAVGQFSANGLGLFDMHGNVAEWCNDWYGDYFTSATILENPDGPLTGTRRVVRGGSFRNSPNECRSASRGSLQPDSTDSAVGFRVICELRKVAPDFTSIRQHVRDRLHPCVWEYAEVHRLTEHPSRYAALSLVPAEANDSKYELRILMRFAPKEVQGYIEWAIKGQCDSVVRIMRSGRNVHVHLIVATSDLIVRAVESGRPDKWQKRAEATEPIFAELWCAQKPESYDRVLPAMLRTLVRVDDELNPIKDADGQNIAADRMGWLEENDIIRFNRVQLDAEIDWIGDSFDAAWKQIPDEAWD